MRFDKIYLVGYTPTPIDRFGRTQSEINKTSLGASQYIAWEHKDDIAGLIDDLQKQGNHVLAIEITEDSQSLLEYQVPAKVAFILGNEVEGVSELALRKSDVVCHIPMLGKKESLNVSVTAGVVLYHDLYQ